MEHSHFLLALTSLRRGAQKGALFSHIVCRVYLSDLARMIVFLKYCSPILAVLLHCCFKTTPTDKHWEGDFEFFIHDDSLFLRFPKDFMSNESELVTPVACLATLTSE